jgi:ATP-dependent Clp protease protease subunit
MMSLSFRSLALALLVGLTLSCTLVREESAPSPVASSEVAPALAVASAQPAQPAEQAAVVQPEQPQPGQTPPAQPTGSQDNQAPAAAPALGAKSPAPAEAQPPAMKEQPGPAPKPEEVSEQEKKKKALEDERSLLAAEYQLLMQRSMSELSKMELEKKNIEVTGALAKAKQDEALAALRAEMERLKTESDLAAARRAKESETLRIQAEEASARNAVQMAKLAEMRGAVEAAKLQRDTEIAQTKSLLELVDTKRAGKNKVDKDIPYKKNPFENGVLEITDRRIPLNGPIYDGSADEVITRIEFYNNQSTEYPIFIVIDSSPGGSVMSGERILRAMKASKAPIYVVVKSFAASMAACIATLAPHSYIYPNAVMLHHQPSSGIQGNLTQQREQLVIGEEWGHRLMTPVAEKLGLSEKKFVELMYKNNSDGDWMVFGNKAKELKWVDNVAPEARELSVTDIAPPPAPKPMPSIIRMEEERDAQGRPFVRVPRLLPCDMWFIYNPDNYYRN